MSEMKQDELENLLAQDRGKKVVVENKSGGTVGQQNAATGRTVTEVVEVGLPDLDGVDPDRMSQVSAQLDMSRNSNYNKVEITLWARTPCEVGDEPRQADRLVRILNSKAQEYMTAEGLPLLRHWSQG